jgi:hypothetical protein
VTQRYVFPTRVVKAEERKLARRGYKDEKGDIVVEYDPLGYFVVLNGFREAIRLSDDDLGVIIGASARLIIEIDDEL